MYVWVNKRATTEAALKNNNSERPGWIYSVYSAPALIFILNPCFSTSGLCWAELSFLNMYLPIWLFQMAVRRTCLNWCSEWNNVKSINLKLQYKELSLNSVSLWSWLLLALCFSFKAQLNKDVLYGLVSPLPSTPFPAANRMYATWPPPNDTQC